jgi:Putative zinc-finger
MMLVPCEGVREHLEAFHDGELPLEAHLAVRAHLDECAGCAYEVDALRRLSEAFRDAPVGRTLTPPEGWAGSVLEQVQVERQLSWHTWLAHVFDDMHLVWPAIGATAAVVICLFASAGVMQATTVQRPDSLAGVIGYLASPGSNVNPARIDEFTMVPRRHESSDWPLAGEDAVLALSTVVTREGRIQSIDVLAAEQARALKVKPEVVLAMIEAASRAQFEPARAGGAPVAVSMVWLLAHTTVVGSAADVERLMRPLAPSAEMGPGPQVRRRPLAKPVALVPVPVAGAAATTVSFAG